MSRLALILLAALAVACSEENSPHKHETKDPAGEKPLGDAAADDDDDDDEPPSSTTKDGGTRAMDARVPSRDGGTNTGKDAAADAGKDAAKDAAIASLDAAVDPESDSGVGVDAASSSDAASDNDASEHRDSSLGSDAGEPRDASLGSDASTASDGGTDSGRVPGTPGAASARTVSVGSTSRTFQLYIPSGLSKTVPVPFVSVHHGFTMSGKIMEQITTWKAIAEREGIVVAFPDGGNGAGPWNVGAGVCSPGDTVSAPDSQDDFGFVKAIIDSANADQAIDRARVFVGGFSMGGFFANNVGCKARDLVRAVAAHSSGTYAGTCSGKPVPVLMIHGDADGLIDYNSCGRTAYNSWVTRNGCSTEVESESIKEGTCAWNKQCPAGQELGFCTLRGMNHGWAGAEGNGDYLGAVFYPVTMDATVFGGGAKYENAAELMWKFFKRYL